MMLETSIETIGGELCTVIKRPFCAGAVRKSLAMGVPALAETRVVNWHVVLIKCDSLLFRDADDGIYAPSQILNTITILPALPQHPKPENAAVVHRYIAEGLYPYGLSKGSLVHADDWLVDHRIGGMEYPFEIKGAHDADGNHVEIAIKGGING